MLNYVKRKWQRKIIIIQPLKLINTHEKTYNVNPSIKKKSLSLR